MRTIPLKKRVALLLLVEKRRGNPQEKAYDGQVMLVKVKFEKGAIGTPHTHYHTQTTYVASGKFEFTVGNEKKTVKAGDGIYIEPDILHGCVCLEPGVLIDCFAPMRSDFLK